MVDKIDDARYKLDGVESLLEHIKKKFCSTSERKIV